MGLRRDTITGKKWHDEKLDQITFLLLQGLSQKQTAEELGIAEKTICEFKKANPVHFEKIEKALKKEINKPYKMDMSKPVFIVHAKRKFPEYYEIVLEIEQSLNKVLKLL